MKYHNHPNIFNIVNMYPYVTVGSPYSHNHLNASNIANLLGHIGSKINMSYSCDRSGANKYDALNAFNVDYNYSTSNVVPMSINTIKTDILNNKPIYLRGNGTKEVVITQTPRKFIGRMTIGRTRTQTVYDNGQAWVGDGYEKITGYYHNPNNNTYFYATLADHVHMN